MLLLVVPGCKDKRAEILERAAVDKAWLCEQAKAKLTEEHRKDIKEVLGDCQVAPNPSESIGIFVTLKVRAEVYEPGRVTSDVKETRKGVRCIFTNPAHSAKPWMCSN